MWRNLYRQIDRSPRLSVWLQALSNNLSRRRGLPTLIAIGLIFISLILHLIIDLFPTGHFVIVLADLFLHLGILIGLLGVLLAEPLGRG